MYLEASEVLPWLYENTYSGYTLFWKGNTVLVVMLQTAVILGSDTCVDPGANVWSSYFKETEDITEKLHWIMSSSFVLIRGGISRLAVPVVNAFEVRSWTRVYHESNISTSCQMA